MSSKRFKCHKCFSNKFTIQFQQTGIRNIILYNCYMDLWVIILSFKMPVRYWDWSHAFVSTAFQMPLRWQLSSKNKSQRGYTWKASTKFGRWKADGLNHNWPKRLKMLIARHLQWRMQRTNEFTPQSPRKVQESRIGGSGVETEGLVRSLYKK